ncbi:MAG TPA: family 2A encapsulin nanocompartment cargo protein cysteine desulfurase, partial [Caulobacteraceae bacterium]|nr:family 2A encapsulin nanocompartment cargo protein cysteine desulfurase [Caulobacteraceae bacterium]
MTTSPSTGEAELASPGVSPTGQGLPEEAEIARWANALFSALPGLEGASEAPTMAGADGGAAAAARSVTNGPLAAPSLSAGGLGLSPSGIPEQSLALNAIPLEGYLGGGLPGAGLPPLGVSGIGPVGPLAAPSLSGWGASPTQPSPPKNPDGFAYPGDGGLPRLGSTPEHQVVSPTATSGTDLYVLTEAQGRKHGAPASGSDWLTARADLLPGAEDLTLVIGDIPESRIEPRPSTGAPDFEQAPALAAGGHPAFDVQAVRRDFPILAEKIHGRPLIWFDNGATTQKPQAVIDRLAYFYAHENSNIHRAAHTLAAHATDAYENARKTVARFLGAGSPDEIVFVRGATEAINLVAQAWGRQHIGEGDEIIVSHLEHHANIVPWQQLAAEKGAKIKVIPVDDSGQVLLSEYERLLSDKTKIVAVTQVSNALGTVVPIEAIIARAHAAGAKTLIDGAQSVAHARVNVQALDADFFVFSGHKIFAPTGIGVLFGKREILEAMQPWQGGGNMIADVTFEKTIYAPPPARFEAGTGNLADAVGLGAALDYLERIGLENIARHEHDLLEYATRGLLTVPGLRIIGTAAEKVSVLSFLLEGFEPSEVGAALDRYGIAVRSGHHCAQPILRRFGLEGTVRASLALYNTFEEADCLVSAL